MNRRLFNLSSGGLFAFCLLLTKPFKTFTFLTLCNLPFPLFFGLLFEFFLNAAHKVGEALLVFFQTADLILLGLNFIAEFFHCHLAFTLFFYQNLPLFLFLALDFEQLLLLRERALLDRADLLALVAECEQRLLLGAGKIAEHGTVTVYLMRVLPVDDGLPGRFLQCDELRFTDQLEGAFRLCQIFADRGFIAAQRENLPLNTSAVLFEFAQFPVRF